MRRKAKEINFGIIYGMSKYGLASRLSIPVEEAEAFIDQYFIEYPNVHNFMMNAIADGRKHGEAVTISGRKRQLTEINAENRMIREGAERVAINTPIQGSAADLIKIAMINVQREMDEKKLQSKMILQVHDELVFDVLTSELSVMKELIIRNMETAIEMSVPLKVELGAGKNWLEAH
jgi:DNA polymerase-1